MSHAKALRQEARPQRTCVLSFPNGYDAEQVNTLALQIGSDPATVLTVTLTETDAVSAGRTIFGNLFAN